MKTAKTAKTDIADENIYYTEKACVGSFGSRTSNKGRDPDMGHCLGHNNMIMLLCRNCICTFLCDMLGR